MRRLLLVSVLSAAGLAGTWLPATASACSCAQVEPADRLAEGEPAFTGRVVSRRRHEGDPGVHGDESYTYVLRVGHSFNRPHRRRLRLRAGTQSAACGVIFRRGERVGAFVYRSAGTLTTNSCSVVDPDDLIRAGRRGESSRPGASGGSCRSLA